MSLQIEKTAPPFLPWHQAIACFCKILFGADFFALFHFYSFPQGEIVLANKGAFGKVSHISSNIIYLLSPSLP